VVLVNLVISFEAMIEHLKGQMIYRGKSSYIISGVFEISF